ncbi:hypothetical protein ACN27E_12135 [Mycobacterium sp. WMMD1722]|uniref:hypothetical protein n=1 Tax=Mycobacterium sp. WMMD1722 TaxID=3404117 RepID=UPI003BF5DEF6
MADINKSLKNVAAATVLGGSVLFTAGLGIAGAQPADAPDGLVTVAVGGTPILESVSTEAAATAAGAICGSTTPEVNAMAESVDVAGTPQTVCSGLPGGDLAIQNASLSTEAPESAPGTAQDVPEAPRGAAEAPQQAQTGTDVPADAAPVQTVPGQTG